MSDEIKIEKGIPIPKTGNKKGGFADLFRSMEIGDSILLTKFGSFSTMAKQAGGKISYRKEGGGYRVWRTA